MKKSNKLSIVIAIVLVLVLAVLATGCAPLLVSSGSQNGTDTQSGDVINVSGAIVSYVSTDSTVYSSTAEVVAAVADTVVEISTETVTTGVWGRQYIVSGAGSGVLVGVQDNTYFIITNNHVIDGANEITVRTRSGVSYSGMLVATDDSMDIAVVAIESASQLSVAKLGNSDQLQIGEDLIAIGNPLGNLGGTVTKGILSATGRSIQVNNYAMTLLQTDTAINPGNSGGGLFNMKGELIGVVNAKTADEEIEGICFAIPINIASAVYESLVQYGYLVGRASFNVEVSEMTVSYDSWGFQTKTVLCVASLKDNAADGFALYDMIYKINGAEITSLLDYNIAMSKIAVGDKVTVEVYRGTSNRWNTGINFASESTTFTTTAKQYGV